jgi:hypothetical protein
LAASSRCDEQASDDGHGTVGGADRLHDFHETSATVEIGVDPCSHMDRLTIVRRAAGCLGRQIRGIVSAPKL